LGVSAVVELLLQHTFQERGRVILPRASRTFFFVLVLIEKETVIAALIQEG
jgi:hypothetical protein